MSGMVEVAVCRVFPVTPETLFDAWQEPDQLARWMFGPSVRDERIVHLQAEAGVGGRFSFLVERNGQRIDHVGVYEVIERPHRLVFTWGIAGESAQDGSRVTVDIAAHPDGCELRLTHALPARWADYVERTRQGWEHMLDALSRLLS